MELLSDRLARIGSGPVELFSEPDRDRAFPEGPSLWAVGVVPVRGGSLYASYGLSGALDADRAASFELSILVPGPPQPWPALLLRAMAHDMRSSQRDRVIGEIIAFDDAITRCFAAPAERSEYSESKQTVVVLTADPLLSVPGVEIRRVLGLDRSEQRLLESWSLSGFLDILQSMDPTLSTDPARPSLADDHRFVEQIATGSRKEGSAYGLVCVPGVRWTLEGDSFRLELPAGPDGDHLWKMARARLAFARDLRILDEDPTVLTDVLLLPGEHDATEIEGNTLTFTISDVETWIGNARLTV